MIIERSMPTYINKKVIPVLCKANQILPERLRSGISLTFGETQYDGQDASIDIHVTPAVEGIGGKGICASFHLTRRGDWWLRFNFYGAFSWTHFPANAFMPPYHRSFLPFALSFYAYVWSNFLVPLAVEKCLRPDWCIIQKVWLDYKNGIPMLYITIEDGRVFSVSSHFHENELCVIVSSPNWGKFYVEKLLPYGDQFLIEMAHTLAKYFQICKV